MTLRYRSSQVAAAPGDADAKGAARLAYRSPGAASWIGLLALVLASLPLAAAAWAPPGIHFQGLFAAASDQYQYLSFMAQGMEGGWLVDILSTPEETPRILIFPAYVLLGKLGAALGMQVVTIFHASRFAFGAILLAVVWVLIKKAADAGAVSHPVFAFAIVCFGSGVAWIARPLGVRTADLWQGEMTTFQALATNPHTPLAQVLLVISLMLFWRGCESRDMFRPLGAGGCVLLLSFVLPYSAPLALAVMAAYGGLVAWRGEAPPRVVARALATVLLIGGAGVLAQYTIYRGPGVGYVFDWAAQIQGRANPWLLLGGMGFLLPAATFRVVSLQRQGALRGLPLLLAVWAATALALSLAPRPMRYQIRMLNGIGIPLGILGAEGLWRLAAGGVHRLKRLPWGRPILVGIILGAVSLTDVLVLLRPFLGHPWVLSNEARRVFEAPLAFSADEVEALRWLRSQPREAGVVLAGLPMSNALPALALKKVVAGHDSLTIEFERKRHDLEAFFHPAATAAERKAILRKYRVGYVYYGPDEQRRTGLPVLADAVLEQAFRNATVAVYRVKG